MGIRVDVAALAHLRPLALSAALVAAAFLGKLACGLGVPRRSGIDRLVVGLAMVPHGEVTLIFAGIGAVSTIAGRPVVAPDTFSALVMVVVLTALATPLLLRWRLAVAGSPTRV
jgi:Kef-type K+ transport system membrane component KefB